MILPGSGGPDRFRWRWRLYIRLCARFWAAVFFTLPPPLLFLTLVFSVLLVFLMGQLISFLGIHIIFFRCFILTYMSTQYFRLVFSKSITCTNLWAFEQVIWLVLHLKLILLDLVAFVDSLICFNVHCSQESCANFSRYTKSNLVYGWGTFGRHWLTFHLWMQHSK